jgi:hypothetical protein
LPNAKKRQRIKDQAIDTLPHHGGADGARPQMLAAGQDLHAGQYKGIGHFAGPERRDGGKKDARHLAKDLCQRRLAGPIRRRRKFDDDKGHRSGKDGCAKTDPDNTAGAGKAINLGQDVAEDVGQREEQDAGAKGHRAKDGNRQLRRLARADQVRADQDDSERRHGEIIIAQLPPGEGIGVDRDNACGFFSLGHVHAMWAPLA